ncbi:MAG: protein kinase [Thermoanaerobaculia bacterium]|nr:protein kinase [Thermoanaerobaculia bacterium]
MTPRKPQGTPDPPTQLLPGGPDRRLESPGNTAGELPVRGVLDMKPGSVFGRYRVRELLGSGGMGHVFLAWDETLARNVALKLLRETDPHAVERLLVEARAQARLRHENVCQIYEAGTQDGLPFVAMQFVDGQPLDRVAHRLTVEEKVKLGVKVAEALHAAHREGVIHRDVKPANILVEKQPDGSLRPYLVDFGLAREGAGTNLTVTGFVVGTPQYMSPEQARGDKSVDRRTDIFGLGVTLFELLTGRAPFEGATGMDVMMKIVSTDAPPVRRLASSLPADLATIVDKCLMRDPGARYDSAKALAEDLESFLAGDPISARPLTLLQHAARFRRRHRAAVAVGSLALVLLLAVVSAWTWSAMASRRRIAIARTFAQEAERIETALRMAYLLPLHDTTRTKAETRNRMERVAEAMRELGRDGRGPGAFALGRGHLALRDFEKARSLLEDAWKAGYQEPEVAHALGEVLGVLYERARENTRRIENKEAREARLLAVERDLRDPALEWLKKGRSGPTSATLYTQAFLASVAGDIARAEASARRAFQVDPGLFEAIRLAGEMALLDAVDLQRRGETARAAERFAQASETLEKAIDTARSDPASYEAAARLRLEEAVAAYQGGRSPEASIAKGLAACTAARSAEPESPWAPEIEAWLLFWLADYKSSRGSDPRPTLVEARKRADEAIRLLPPHPEIWSVRGQLGWVAAKWHVTHSEDPRDGIEASIADFKRALEIDPTFAPAYGNIGNVLLRRAEWERDRGIDSRPTLARAVDSYTQGIARSPKVASLRLNLSAAYFRQAYAERSAGGDPRPHFENAIRAAVGAQELNPAHYIGPFSEGNGTSGLAEEAIQRGEDPTALVEKTVAAYDRSIALKKDFANAHANKTMALNVAAVWRLAAGQDVSRALEEAQQPALRAVELKPDLAESYTAVAESRSLLAFQLSRDGKPTGTAWNWAWEILEKGSAVSPRNAELERARARCSLRALEDGFRTRRPDAALLFRARSALEKATSLSPDDVEAKILAIRLARVEAQLRLSRQEPVEVLIKDGLARADEILKTRPSSDARFERAALLVLRSRENGEIAGPDGGAARRKALAQLETELAKHPAARLEYSPFLTWARR